MRPRWVLVLAAALATTACGGGGGTAPATTPRPGAESDPPAVDASGEPDPCGLLSEEDRVAVAGEPGELAAGDVDRDEGVRTCTWSVGGSVITIALERSEWGPGTAAERFEAARGGTAAESIAGFGVDAWYSTDLGYAVLLDDDRALYVRARTAGGSDRDLALDVVARVVERVP